MTTKFIMVVATIFLTSLMPVQADSYTPMKSTEGEIIFQQVNESSTLLCELLDGDIELGNLSCALYDVANDGSFGKRPSEFSLEGNSLTKKNTIRDFETTYQVEAIEDSFSAATFNGTWLGAADSSFQVVSFQDGNGMMKYNYGEFPESQMSFKLVDNVLMTPKVGGVQFFFLQDGGVTYGLRTDDNGLSSYVVMQSEPYVFDNPAKCAQSYLNHAGYPVGRADGRPGPMSRSGSEKYLAENPNVDLEPFTSNNAKEWCEHMKSVVDAKPGVVAISGF